MATPTEIALRRLADAGIRRDALHVASRASGLTHGPRAYTTRTFVFLSHARPMGERLSDRIGRILADLPGAVEVNADIDTVTVWWMPPGADL
jgi:hypothetical protein